jgi:hypothetical protein
MVSTPELEVHFTRSAGPIELLLMHHDELDG